MHSPAIFLAEAAVAPALIGGAALADSVGIVSIHWEIVIVAAIAAVPATIASIAAYLQAKQTGKRVDGRMEELLLLARKEAASQATLDEKDAEHRRKGEAAVIKANIESEKGQSP